MANIQVGVGVVVGATVVGPDVGVLIELFGSEPVPSLALILTVKDSMNAISLKFSESIPATLAIKELDTENRTRKLLTNQNTKVNFLCSEIEGIL